MAKKRSVHREQVKAAMACEKQSPNSLLYFRRGVLHALQLKESVDLGSEGGSARERNASSSAQSRWEGGGKQNVSAHPVNTFRFGAFPPLVRCSIGSGVILHYPRCAADVREL
jgi:hypothetical protein